MNRSASIAVIAVLLAQPLAAGAQAWPAKPIRLVSSHPLGSNGDIAGRLMAPKMSEKLGQTLVFESRTGANGTIAAGVVANAPPDGYTLLYVGAGTMVSNRFLMKSPPFDTVKDFTPISQGSKAVTFLVVNAAVPANSVPELFDYAKHNPGKLSFGSTGIGSPFHMMGESLMSKAGIDIVHVPYSGGNSAIAQNDLTTGRIQIYFPSYTAVRQHIGGGKVRILAVMDTARYRKLPDVPAITDFVPDYRPVPSWNGYFGPLGLAPAIVARVQASIVAAIEDPGVGSRLDDIGIRAIGNRPEEFTKLMAAEIEEFARAAKAIGITPQ